MDSPKRALPILTALRICTSIACGKRNVSFSTKKDAGTFGGMAKVDERKTLGLASEGDGRGIAILEHSMFQ
jgi:hypothetical protein